MRVGILGGTFNPPHLGHLVCAQEAYIHLSLDRVMLIPVRIPPHKFVDDEPGPEHRLALCRLAIEGDERLCVSDLEIVRPGTSFTVDTLVELHSRTPENDLFLILGGDAAAGLPRWREPERILALASLAVAKRRGTPRAAIEDALGGLKGGESAAFFRMPTIGVSSTMVRDRVRSGEAIKYLVPDAVSSYIERHGLYRGAAPG